MYPFLESKWSAKLTESIEDPKKTLLEYLPKDTALTAEAWNSERENPFQIPGSLVDTFTDNTGTNFDVYCTTFADAASKALHERMQIFILLFIEAGSYIDDEDNHWELFFIYEKSEDGVPTFAGFCTVYEYFWYKNAALHDDVPEPYTSNLRKRISQFVILPSFQHRGVGGRFYDTLIKRFLGDNSVKEISVEDPSEAFDDLRDRCDLTRLGQNGTWSDTNLITANVTPEWLESTREKNKMTPRQFDRCVEMALIKLIDKTPESEKRYRLLVKKRLYLRNKEPLDEMTHQERIDKLEETFEVLKTDYERILSKVNLSSRTKREFEETEENEPSKKVKA